MDPLAYALAMMRGDAEYEAMQQTGGPTQEAASQLSTLDAQNHVAMIEGQARGNPQTMALLDRVNGDYAQAQRSQNQLDLMSGYASDFGLDGFDEQHAARQYEMYQAGTGPQPDHIKRLMYGIPNPPSQFEPDQFSPLDDYIGTTYAHAPQAHDAVQASIRKGSHDFTDPQMEFAAPHNPSWREQAKGWLVDKTSLSFPEAGAVTGNNSMGIGIADFTPAAIPLVYDDVRSDMQAGDVGGAVMTGSIGAATSFPAIKAITKGGGAMVRKAGGRWQ